MSTFFVEGEEGALKGEFAQGVIQARIATEEGCVLSVCKRDNHCVIHKSQGQISKQPNDENS